MFFFPYKGSRLKIGANAQLNLILNFSLNFFETRICKTESQFIIGDNSVFEVSGDFSMYVLWSGYKNF